MVGKLAFTGILSVVALSAVAGTAFATPTFYTNQSGTTVDFINIVEDSNTDPIPLFGAPTVVGDTLKFSPVSFGASSSNGVSVAGPGAIDITDGTLQTTIVAKPGNVITNFNITEKGDYTLVGSPATASTFTLAGIRVFVSVLEVNGSAINPVSGSSVLIANNTNLTAGSVVLGLWSGSLNFDVSALLAANGISGQATRIQVGLDNQLIASSVNGTVAFIKKKDQDGVTITVPAPGAFALLGLGGIVAGRRRRA